MIRHSCVNVLSSILMSSHVCELCHHTRFDEHGWGEKRGQTDVQRASANRVCNYNVSLPQASLPQASLPQCKESVQLECPKRSTSRVFIEREIYKQSVCRVRDLQIECF